jgi:anaerobic selenocysteine-containing dehydrogenase
LKRKSNIKRRTFLKALSGTSMGLAFSSCSQIENLNKKIVNIISSKEEEIVPNGVEKWVLSVCGQCNGGCGIKVRLIDERAVKIEGNPLHPVNQGALCPKGQAGLQLLYDPDRLKSPLKRKGERGENKWEKIDPEAMRNFLPREENNLRPCDCKP